MQMDVETAWKSMEIEAGCTFLEFWNKGATPQGDVLCVIVNRVSDQGSIDAVVKRMVARLLSHDTQKHEEWGWLIISRHKMCASLMNLALRGEVSIPKFIDATKCNLSELIFLCHTPHVRTFITLATRRQRSRYELFRALQIYLLIGQPLQNKRPHIEHACQQLTTDDAMHIDLRGTDESVSPTTTAMNTIFETMRKRQLRYTRRLPKLVSLCLSPYLSCSVSNRILWPVV